MTAFGAQPAPIRASPTAGLPSPPPAASGSAAVAVVHEADEFLVVNKPAGLVCHPSKAGPESSLIGRLRIHLGGAAHPQLIHRLDRETSGLVVAATTAAAARQLRQIWETRRVRKTYLAMVHGVPPTCSGEVDAPLGRDPASAVAIKDTVRPEGAPARTRWQVRRVWRRPEGVFSLLEVEPLTGRKHQIRIHLAYLGHPIVGDKLYGGDERLYLDFVAGRLTSAQQARLLLPFQALHAAELAFAWRDRAWHFTAPPEPWFEAFLTSEGSSLESPASSAVA